VYSFLDKFHGGFGKAVEGSSHAASEAVVAPKRFKPADLKSKKGLRGKCENLRLFARSMYESNHLNSKRKTIEQI
jgi:hypothetical protein